MRNDEIWITFPDPQMKKVNKRLTGTRFMRLYREVLKDGGRVHLKTDSPFLYTYTGIMARHNSLPLLADTCDLYGNPQGVDDILGIRTFYEQQWLDRGLTIKYISWNYISSTSPGAKKYGNSSMLVRRNAAFPILRSRT